MPESGPLARGPCEKRGFARLVTYHGGHIHGSGGAAIVAALDRRYPDSLGGCPNISAVAKVARSHPRGSAHVGVWISALPGVSLSIF